MAARKKKKAAKKKAPQPKTGPGEVSLKDIEGYSKSFQAKPSYKVAMNAVTRGALTELIINRDTLNDQDMVFSEEMESGGPITDQARAGTCWLFAELNWLRTFTAKKKKTA